MYSPVSFFLMSVTYSAPCTQCENLTYPASVGTVNGRGPFFLQKDLSYSACAAEIRANLTEVKYWRKWFYPLPAAWLHDSGLALQGTQARTYQLSFCEGDSDENWAVDRRGTHLQVRNARGKEAGRESSNCKWAAKSCKQKRKTIALMLVLLPDWNCTLEIWEGKHNIWVWYIFVRKLFYNLGPSPKKKNLMNSA